MLMFGRNNHNSVNQLSFNKKIIIFLKDHTEKNKIQNTSLHDWWTASILYKDTFTSITKLTEDRLYVFVYKDMLQIYPVPLNSSFL